MLKSRCGILVPFISPRMVRSIVALICYVTPGWSFSAGIRNLFVLRAYPIMRVRLCLLNMSTVLV